MTSVRSHYPPHACLAVLLVSMLPGSTFAGDPQPGTSTPNDTPLPRGQCFLDCPDDVVTNAAPGLCGANVTFAAPVSSPCVISGTCMPASGTFFNVGVTTVNCQASDPANPGMVLATCAFKVTVKDVEPPTLMCPPPDSITAKADNSGQAEVPDLMNNTGFSENCPAGGSIVSQDPPAGSKVNPGTTNVTVLGKDAAGNTSTCTYALNVAKADCGGGMCGVGAPLMLNVVGIMLLVAKRRRRNW